MQIRLTPAGHLCWESSEDSPESGVLLSAGNTFRADWREGLFRLGAERIEAPHSPTVRYWGEWARAYLTGLCHIPETADSFEVLQPTEGECATRILTAPPMWGGEYLSVENLLKVWEALDQWVHETAASVGGLAAFLQARAPKWCQIGRVCFHLAENKGDLERPFAFMATYTSGFGAEGRLKHLPLRRALEQYAGTKNHSALVKLLTPVQQASESCPWVEKLVESGEIYQPTAWPVNRAYRLLRSVPALEESGLSVRLPNWWQKRPRPKVSVTIGERKKSTLGAEAMLDFSVEMALGDTTLSEEDLAELLNSEGGLVLFKGQWVEVDREKLGQAIDHWKSLQKQAHDGEISFIEGMRLLAGASTDLKHEEETDEERAWAHVTAGEAMRDVLQGLREPGLLDAVEAGSGLNATLRPYQREGLTWLHFLTQLGLGACLADDMGLGKTLQVLALLLQARQGKTKQERSPSLLVVPASLLANWRSEAVRFTPSLDLLFLHPAETDRKILDDIAKSPQKHLNQADLVVTTYSMLLRQEWLMEMQWKWVILDESQAIKNQGTRQSKAVKKLTAQARIALTGTPIENRLGDLWSLFDFLNPGLLGSATTFKNFVSNMESSNKAKFAPLRKLVSPYILRRLKTDRTIIADLPEKTEIIRYCSLTKAQVKLYQQVVEGLEKALDSVDGMARRGLVLQSLMRLKQICNHPSQLSNDAEYKPADSGKFLRLAEICEELAERQEKTLIFTQFREIIPPLAENLSRVFNREGLVLHGGTTVKKRKSIVEEFQRDDGPPFFILSLKAGGTGLNLTAASHVIHFDRWWNPAVENQATDRAFRIGQKRNVLVHKFVTRGTVEERIDALIEEKKQVADNILSSDGEAKLTELSDEALLRLVRLDVSQASL